MRLTCCRSLGRRSLVERFRHLEASLPAPVVESSFRVPPWLTCDRRSCSVAWRRCCPHVAATTMIPMRAPAAARNRRLVGDPLADRLQTLELLEAVAPN